MFTTRKLKTLRPKIGTLGTKLAPQTGTVERRPWAHRDAYGRQLAATERGYGWEWQQLRERILKRDNYLCQCTDCKGGALRLTVAREVDHIIPKAQWRQRHGTLAGVDDPSNLQSIGHECHKRKTARDNGRTVRPRIGLDGYGTDD